MNGSNRRETFAIAARPRTSFMSRLPVAFARAYTDQATIPLFATFLNG